MKIKNEKGVSIYLALMVMSILLALSLGISAILFDQIKIMREMGYSVIAFYAADTGIEKALYEDADETYTVTGYLDLNGNSIEDGGDSKYEVSGLAPGADDCPVGVNFCIKSVGIFKQTRRAVSIAR